MHRDTPTSKSPGHVVTGARRYSITHCLTLWQLFDAVQDGDDDLLDELVNGYGASVEVVDSDGYTLLQR
jgi:hypothetical protein